MEEVAERHYYAPCPHCGAYIELEFSSIRWRPGKPETAVYLCQICGGKITDRDKKKMLKAGTWKEAPEAETGHGMKRWANALYSSVLRFSDIAEEFERSRDSADKLKSFTAFYLAEPWEDGE